jgi:hypothetical protein
MAVILDPCIIPEKGKVELNIQRTFEIKVTAEEARRKVNRWLLDEISYMASADPPTLIVGEQVVWRVPAWIGVPHVGRINEVGAVEVDVETGEMNALSECKVEIEQNLERIKSQVPPYQPKSSAEGSDYLAKNVPSAPLLILPGEEASHVVSKETH